MVVLVAVAPAVWRNWAAIRLALGRIYSDFRDYPEMVTFIHSIVEVVRMKRRRFQQVLESTMFRSIARLLERNNTRHLGPAGGAPHRLLSHKLPTDEIKIYPAMGDDGMPPAAHFITCCSNTLVLLWWRYRDRF